MEWCVPLCAGGVFVSSVIADPVERRRRGFEALVQAIGWVNAVRFLRQYEVGQGDYTRERDAFLPDRDAETLVKRALG
jgi:hypothetical protein